MRITLVTVLLTAAAMLWQTPVQAHHSYGGTYNVDKEVTITGKVVQVSLRSPHSFVYVETENADGSVARWVLEGGAAAQFAQRGIDKDAFKIGDAVVVVAHPARSPNSTRAQLMRITRTSDGKSWVALTGER